MDFKTCDLPGIGRKYSLNLANGKHMVMITHNQGQRELYVFDDPDDDEPEISVEFNDEESRQMGAILLGVDYQPIPDDKIEMISKKIRMSWFKVDNETCFAGSKIEDSGIRQFAGVTIIGIERGDDFIANPESSEVILEGDVLMVIGKKEPIKELKKMCEIKKKPEGR